MAKLEIILGKLLFNLDHDVGRNSPNRLDDVELVRFGYFCAKVSPKLLAKHSAEMKVALQNLRTDGPYLSDLQDVIDIHQRTRGGPQDGKISTGKSRATHSFSYDSQHSWIIFSLSGLMFERIPDTYPRIDLEDQSGSEISRRIQELVLLST